MNTYKWALASTTAIVGAALIAVAAHAADTTGITDDTIKIGNTNPYSGPASSYGTIGKALTACFKMVNDNGGIHGRKIDFVSLDDSYSPPKTVEQIRKLVEQEKVAFLFQTLGTPTNTAIHKYVNQKKVPHLFVATGAGKWGHPKEFPWSMGWQPSYPTESQIYAKYVLDNVDNPKVAVLYQNDDYGKDYYHAFRDAFGDKAGEIIVAAEPYETTDASVDPQMVKLANSGANVFFNVTIPKFASQAIRKAADLGWKPLHLLNNVSASVGTVLKPAGFENSVGIITSQYLKDPTDPQFKEDADYKEWEAFMDKYYPDGDKTNAFNGYAYSVCNTLVHVLEKAGRDISREKLMEAAASIDNLEVPMLLSGITVDTGPDDFYPIEAMQLARFDGEIFVRFGEIIDVGK